ENVTQRMADKFDIHAHTLVKRGLKRQNCKDLAHGALDLADALAAPQPYGRAHVVHRRNAARLEARFEPEVEVWRIDADEKVRRLRKKPPPQPAPYTKNLKKRRGPLDVPANRKFFERIPHFHAGRFHARTADPRELKVRHHLTQGKHELTA